MLSMGVGVGVGVHKYTDETVPFRVCGYGEIQLYFKNIKDLDAPKPNLNCNSSSWGLWCESGWSAMQSSTDTVDLNSETVPVRNLNPLPCCDGFFCPKGLSCMFRKCSPCHKPVCNSSCA